MVKRRLQVCGRLLTVCIVIYRYVLVLHPSLVETAAQKRVFQCLILATIFLLPVLVSSYGVYYRNYYYNYLGQVQSFRGILNPTICYAVLFSSAQNYFVTSMHFSSLDFVLPSPIFLHISYFAECSERVHEFYYDFTDFYEDISEPWSRGEHWRLPLTNSFRLFQILCLSSSFIVVPFCYGSIYRSIGLKSSNQKDNTK